LLRNVQDAASGRAVTGRSGLKAALIALDGRVATAGVNVLDVGEDWIVRAR
jgi:hypothetical protein